jgi:hypothetical protein
VSFQYLTLWHRAAGRIDIDVLAKLPQQQNFLFFLDFKTARNEWRFQPRSIELGDEHTWRNERDVHFYSFLRKHEGQVSE